MENKIQIQLFHKCCGSGYSDLRRLYAILSNLDFNITKLPTMHLALYHGPLTEYYGIPIEAIIKDPYIMISDGTTTIMFKAKDFQKEVTKMWGYPPSPAPVEPTGENLPVTNDQLNKDINNVKTS